MHIKKQFLIASCFLALCVLTYVFSTFSGDYRITPIVYKELFDEIEFLEDVALGNLDLLKKVNPAFPIELYEAKKTPKSINSSCGVFPELKHINFNNLYWQRLQIGNVNFHLLGAYYDVRAKNKRRPTVRILAMVDSVDLTMDTYCQLWFGNKVILTKKTWSYYVWRKAWGVKGSAYHPHLISCQVPKGYKNAPIGVSLVAKPCDKATNNLKVAYNKSNRKKDFAVCVKGLDFEEDSSEKLVEWIELVHLLGASKIYFYELHVHDKIKKVLKFYEKKGMVEVTPLTLPGALPNLPHLQHEYLHKNLLGKRLNELMPYNDCFYKHMYQYEYIVLLDTDEVIMPKNGTWKDLMGTVLKKLDKKGRRSSYNVRNVYFIDEFLHDHGWFPDIPKHMHMLQHVYRTKNYTKPGSYIKSFHDTEKILALHNHYPFYCVETCTSYGIEVADAQLQHYREDCVKDLKSCKELKKDVILDTTIWRYKNALIERVQRTLQTLEFVK